MKETRLKKSKIAIFLILLLLGLGVWIFYEEKIHVAEVVSVSMLRDDWWKEYDMCQGKVTNKISQEVLSENGKKLDDLYVELGQKVKEGDLLLTFDVEEEKIQRDLKASEAKAAELELSKAKERLEELKQETPVEDEDAGYTEAQLATLIRNKNAEIQELEMTYKQLQLEYESYKKQVDAATVTSTIDGVVKEIHVDGAETGEPVVVVAGEDKLYVEGVVDEFSYHSVKAGTTITAVSWETGNTFQAKITKISDYPETGEDKTVSSGQNPNVSYYPFQAVITDELTEVSAGETVNINFDGMREHLFLPLAYLKSEDGKSYVYVCKKGERLKKQEVTTGQALYNTVIEITEGLSSEDYIAFPYGNHVSEGAKTIPVTECTDLVY